MYKVGVVGAGVGGSYLTYLLSRRGIDTIIFDPRAPHEKLCGGGVTPKAMADFPLLRDLPCPRNEVRDIRVISPNGGLAAIKLEKPLTIFNRKDLDYELLRMGMGLGAHFRRERMLGFVRERNHWRIFTDQGAYETEILVGADGAVSRTRKKLGVPTEKNDCFLAIECFLGLTGDCATFMFFPDLMGYLWAFPRVDKTGVGIIWRHDAGKGIDFFKAMLQHYIEAHFPGYPKRISFRGAVIPVFSAKKFHHQRICSDNWALIGDAGSFVDPVSGEGIYYALHSADILALCIAENSLARYQHICMESIGGILFEASQSYQYLYRDRFIGTMIALAGKSKAMRGIVSEMMEGDIKYISYRWRFARYVISLLSMLGWSDKT